MLVLLIEDEPKTVQSLKQGLEENNMDVHFAYDGQTGKNLAEKNAYNVIVSDVILPQINGIELCKLLRGQGLKTPILLLSALSDTSDKVLGLEAGADDYLGKPFEFQELLVRIRALARRFSANYKEEEPPVLAFADLEMMLHTKECFRASKKIELTPREFALLEYLIRNKGRIISKTEIAEAVWGVNFDTGTNVIEVYVNYLRNKMDKGFDKKIIHTVFGSGYILRE